MTKISDLSNLTADDAEATADFVPIVDASEVGTARNNKITPAELVSSVAPKLRITWDGAISVVEDE